MRHMPVSVGARLPPPSRGGFPSLAYREFNSSCLKQFGRRLRDFDRERGPHRFLDREQERPARAVDVLDDLSRLVTGASTRITGLDERIILARRALSGLDDLDLEGSRSSFRCHISMVASLACRLHHCTGSCFSDSTPSSLGSATQPVAGSGVVSCGRDGPSLRCRNTSSTCRRTLADRAVP